MFVKRDVISHFQVFYPIKSFSSVLKFFSKNHCSYVNFIKKQNIHGDKGLNESFPSVQFTISSLTEKCVVELHSDEIIRRQH